ncbi:hypothetical protein OHAE_2451 [Ochrobactrum soli]|uniref:Uncharacterized protein n=1 Tax=Ochrobactrum soli TaxID=2448455 RepID=A0A2P9HR31_9HYPH|nr:hypothetical protein OHAE_2451 [[Ochrobactrum] soli]
MHLLLRFVKKLKQQQGVAVTILRKAGRIMPDIMRRNAFGK